jgi:drug/metabolite transporter (DMT)-like permease
MTGLVAALLCLAAAPLFMRYLARSSALDPWTMNAARYSLVAGFCLPFAIWRTVRSPETRRVWWSVRRVAMASIVGQATWGISAYHNEAGIIAFVIRSSFLFATVYSIVLLPGERATVARPRFWLGAAGVLAGMTLLFWDALHSGGSSLFGLAMLLLSAAAWGLYWVLVKRDLAGHDQPLGFAVNAIYTAVALILAMFLFGDWRTLAGVSSQLWGILACSGCMGLLLAHMLLYHTIQRLGPVITDGTKCVQPFLTAIGAWFILHEALQTAQWVGGFVLVGSSALLLSLRFGRRNVVAPVSIPAPLAGEES